MTDMELLAEAIKEAGSMTAAAEKIGISKTSVSLVLAGKYPNPERIFERLRKSYGYILNATVLCPGLKAEIHREVCSRYSEAVRDGNTLGGISFKQVSDTCPYCAFRKR